MEERSWKFGEKKAWNLTTWLKNSEEHWGPKWS